MNKVLATLFFGLFAASMAQAQQATPAPFSYTIAEISYLNGSADIAGSKLDMTGMSLTGSVAVNDSLFVSGSYGDGKAKISGSTIKSNTFSLGFGGHIAIGSQTDLVGSLSYINSKVTAPGRSQSDNGYGFNLGVRHAVTKELELNAGLGMTFLGADNDRTTTLSAGARYKVADKISLGLGYTNSSADAGNSRGFLGSVRMEF